MTAFVQLVEMSTSRYDDPRTSEYAAGMAALCDGPPTFRNLDVVMNEGID